MALAISACVTPSSRRSSASDISTSSASMRRSCSARSVSEKRLRRISDHFLAMGCLQVFAPQPLRERDHRFVESVVTGLVAADQQDGLACRIEGVKAPYWAPARLNTKLTQRERGVVDGARVREAQMDAAGLQKTH